MGKKLNIYPVTIPQKIVLLECLIDPGRKTYTEQVILRLRGQIKIGRIIQCWESLYESHSLLRARVVWRNLRSPIMVVSEGINRIKAINLGEFSVNKQIDIIKDISDENWRNTVNIEKESFIVNIIEQSNNEYILILDFHHIFIDGWSLSTILSEFMFTISYGDDRKGLTDNYSKYISYYMSAKKNIQLQKYWSSYVTKMEKKYSVRQNIRAEGNMRKLDIPVPTDIKKICFDITHKNGITFAALFYYLWASVLNEVLSADDICFGISVSGRDIPVDGVEKIVGMLVHTVLLKVDKESLNKDEPFLIMKSIMDDVQKSSQHSISFYPYLQSIGLSMNNEFHSIVTIQNYPNVWKSYCSNNTLELISRNFTNNIPLTFNIRWLPNDIYFDYTYTADIYDELFIKRVNRFIEMKIIDFLQ